MKGNQGLPSLRVVGALAPFDDVHQGLEQPAQLVVRPYPLRFREEVRHPSVCIRDCLGLQHFPSNAVPLGLNLSPPRAEVF